MMFALPRSVVALIVASVVMLGSGAVRAQAPAAPDEWSAAISARRVWVPNLNIAASAEHQAAMRYGIGEQEHARGAGPGAICVPCAGSVCAGDAKGAAITGAGLAVAVGLVLYGVPVVFAGLPDQSDPPPTVDDPGLRAGAFLAGMSPALISRIYGVYNAVRATTHYIDGLRRSLGLTPTIFVAEHAVSETGSNVVGPIFAGHFDPRDATIQRHGFLTPKK